MPLADSWSVRWSIGPDDLPAIRPAATNRAYCNRKNDERDEDTAALSLPDSILEGSLVDHVTYRQSSDQLCYGV